MWLLLLLCGILFIHKAWLAWDSWTEVHSKGTTNQSNCSLQFASNWADNKLLGVGTAFNAKLDRVYVKADLNCTSQADSISLVWYHYGNKIFQENIAKSNAVLSSLSPTLLVEGEWSVDVLQGNTLLGSGQFVALNHE